MSRFGRIRKDPKNPAPKLNSDISSAMTRKELLYKNASRAEPPHNIRAIRREGVLMSYWVFCGTRARGAKYRITFSRNSRPARTRPLTIWPMPGKTRDIIA